ncbi:MULTISPECIES: hypothetical protein [unclassified Helicobacter]|uniref:hypothetical protein n=1 Tax=unclassified Helicobacter TaxID=2593540 RepID=UPI00115FC784|nr:MULTISPECIES: hypothetical protein [unclassified Helicobacter]
MPFSSINAIRFYVLAFILGLFALCKQRKDILYICILSFVIYLSLSFFAIYPFGSQGVIGGRLSLFMSVIFYISICYFLCALHLSKKFYIRIIANLLLATITIAAFVAYKKPIIKHQFFMYQQTHRHITNIANSATPNDAIFVAPTTRAGFLYYSYIDNVVLPHEVVDLNMDIKLLQNKMQQAFGGGKNVWFITINHTPEWQKDFIEMVGSSFSNIADFEIDTRDGVIFARIAHKK